MVQLTGTPATPWNPMRRCSITGQSTTAAARPPGAHRPAGAVRAEPAPRRRPRSSSPSALENSAAAKDTEHEHEPDGTEHDRMAVVLPPEPERRSPGSGSGDPRPQPAAPASTLPGAGPGRRCSRTARSSPGAADGRPAGRAPAGRRSPRPRTPWPSTPTGTTELPLGAHRRTDDDVDRKVLPQHECVADVVGLDRTPANEHPRQRQHRVRHRHHHQDQLEPAEPDR